MLELSEGVVFSSSLKTTRCDVWHHFCDWLLVFFLLDFVWREILSLRRWWLLDWSWVCCRFLCTSWEWHHWLSFCGCSSSMVLFGGRKESLDIVLLNHRASVDWQANYTWNCVLLLDWEICITCAVSTGHYRLLLVILELRDSVQSRSMIDTGLSSIGLK